MTAGDVKSRATDAVRRARPWIVPLASLGYAARGTVYLLIGMMAALAAFHTGGETTNFSDVLLRIFVQPFGGVLLALLALGLAGYSLWQMIRALMDTDGKGTTFTGIVRRLFDAGVGLFYAVLCYSALRLLAGARAIKEGDRPERQWTARSFAFLPFGRWAVAAVGVGLVGFCLYEVWRAYTREFRVHFMREELNPAEDALMTRVGQIGIVGRGVVFALIGISLIRAAIDYNPKEAKGVGGALGMVTQLAYGRWLLAAIALGLVA
jgi:hypothetical protein